MLLLIPRPAMYKAHLPIPTQGEGNAIQDVPKQHFPALLRVVANTFGPAPSPVWLARTWWSCNYSWQQELPPLPLHSFWRTNSFLSNHSGHKSEFQVSHLLFHVHCSCAGMLFRNKIPTKSCSGSMAESQGTGRGFRGTALSLGCSYKDLWQKQAAEMVMEKEGI